MKNILIIITIILIYSCGPGECNNLVYKDGITTQNDILYTGKCKTMFSDGQIRSYQEYHRGKDHGEWIFYFEDGQIRTKGTFKKGKRIGKWDYYYPNGMIKQISHYNEDGMRHGSWIKYDQLGTISNKTIYEKDSIVYSK
tara:strand:- start:272 stop:691 length:420 start_codon:yes stop_codon:yes gene_type:complete